MPKFICPNCGQRIDAEESFAGVIARCPTCRGEVTVPGTSISSVTTPATNRNGLQTAIPESVARNLLIYYLIVLLAPLTMTILPPASGFWLLLKAFGAIIGFASIGNFLSRTDFHRDIIGDAHGGLLILMVLYGTALLFRDSSFGAILWIVSFLVLCTLYPLILKRVRQKRQ
jgi:hypothetical protein